MKEPLKFEIDGKQVTFFKNEDKGAPIIYANMHTEVGHSVIEQCKKLGCRPFHLVSITSLRWDEELSPMGAPYKNRAPHKEMLHFSCIHFYILPAIFYRLSFGILSTSLWSSTL